MKRALLATLAGIAVAVGVAAPGNAAEVYACAWQMVTVYVDDQGQVMA